MLNSSVASSQLSALGNYSPSSHHYCFFRSKPSIVAPSSRLRFSAVRTSATPPRQWSMATSFYEVLGIPMGASLEEIKSAYRRLARACHPDVVAMERKERSTDEFVKIHAAYSTLLDPKKRVDYDRTLFRRRHQSHRFTPQYQYAATSAASSSSSSSSSSRFSGYSTRRTWETDQCW